MLVTRIFCPRITHFFHQKIIRGIGDIKQKVANDLIIKKMEKELISPGRNDPIIMKLNTPEFHSIFTPELKLLADMFKKYQYELRVAGGAVRDILMGIKPTDLDFATNATPTQMKEMFTNEEIRMINANGEKHGTITARINDKENFEVTTLRIDVVTDGRRAEVLFTNNWRLDANRRDLTINSMYLDLEGNVYDYFYGYDDLQNRRVVFVGDANTRIQEDYLRILRYFRFYGKVANDAESHDNNIINTIKKNVAGLERISGERIWVEWQKILDGRFGCELTIKMIECGIAEYMGLPEEPNIQQFEDVYHRAVNNKIKLRPIAIICALLKDEEEVMNLHKRLKLSAYDRDLGLFVITHRDYKPCKDALQPYKRLVIHGKTKDIKKYIIEVLKYRGAMELLHEFDQWEVPKFPINGNMVKPHLSHNKLFGQVIYKLKDIWLDHDFQISTNELIELIPSIVSELEEKRK